MWRNLQEIEHLGEIFQGPFCALGPQAGAGPDEDHCAETAILSRRGQKQRVDWVSCLLEYCIEKLSMVGGILGREAPWSLMGTALEVLKLGLSWAPHPVYSVPANPLPDFTGMFSTKKWEDFPVTSLILLPREESDLQS